jgi:hypothetical protein
VPYQAGPHPDTGRNVIKFIAKCPHVFIEMDYFLNRKCLNLIIYDVKCENGHKFEGWFKDRQAWIEQNARRLVCCPVCNSSNVEIVPSSIAIMGKDSKMSDKRNNPEISPERNLQLFNQYIEKNFEDVGDKFAEVALKIHYGDEEKRNIKGTTTPQEETDLKEQGVSFVKISLPKMDS